MAERSLRADARRNRDRVLRAAAELFAEHGIEAPLDQIAERAGVGAGTVHRHFATKAALFEAVVAERLGDLVEDAEARAGASDAGEAFFGFLARLQHEGARRRDATAALTLPGALTSRLHLALAALLESAQSAGQVRADITAGDLLALLKALSSAIRDQPETGRPQRVHTLIVDGLRTPTQP